MFHRVSDTFPLNAISSLIGLVNQKSLFRWLDIKETKSYTILDIPPNREENDDPTKKVTNTGVPFSSNIFL